MVKHETFVGKYEEESSNQDEQKSTTDVYLTNNVTTESLVPRRKVNDKMLSSDANLSLAST